MNAPALPAVRSRAVAGQRDPSPSAVRAAVASGAVGAGVAWCAERALTASPVAGTAPWQRTNHRGRTLSLLSGPALTVSLAAAADLPRAAAAVAAIGAAAVGRYDDLGGDRHPGARGVRGHLQALAVGRVTSGAVKVVGLAAVGLASATLLERSPGRPAGPPDSRPHPCDLLLRGAVVAGAANLVNLLDLRPGRALKAGGLAALLLRQAGPAAAVVVLLPADLHERTMLGDAGANALGAVLGLALVARRPQSCASALTVIALLTAASEVVSYSRVIDAVPVLRRLDRAGRRP